MSGFFTAVGIQAVKTTGTVAAVLGAGYYAVEDLFPKLRGKIKEDALNNKKNFEKYVLPYHPETLKEGGQRLLLVPIRVHPDKKETLELQPLAVKGQGTWKKNDKGEMEFALMNADSTTPEFARAENNGIATFVVEGWDENKFFGEASARKLEVEAKLAQMENAGIPEDIMRITRGAGQTFSSPTPVTPPGGGSAGIWPKIAGPAAGLVLMALGNFSPISLIGGAALVAGGFFFDDIKKFITKQTGQQPAGQVNETGNGNGQGKTQDLGKEPPRREVLDAARKVAFGQVQSTHASGDVSPKAGGPATPGGDTGVPLNP
jgi:hypothetical protein